MATLLRMSQDASMATALGEHLWPQFLQQQQEAETADSWIRGENALPSMPASQEARGEYEELQEASPTNWARLAISILSQNLYVAGYDLSSIEADGRRTGSKVWERIWQPNRLDSRQIFVHRGALGHGVAYNVCEHATEPLTGKETLKIRSVSALNGVCLWRDPVNDEFPEYAMEVLEEWDSAASTDGKAYRLKIWGPDGKAYTTDYLPKTPDEFANGKGQWEFVDSGSYRADVIPWVRFVNDMDLNGNVTGEVTPFIPLLKRIDQDTFDRLIVQRFGSWKVRAIAGMAKPDNKEDEAALAHILRVSDFLLSDSAETKFSTLDATPLDGYIAARDADIRDYSSVTQIPPHHLLGLSPNVSAEGLVEAQRGLMQKIKERQHILGEAWELNMRLGAHMLNLPEEAGDFQAQVRWEDTEGRSLAQLADALGKLAQMVEIPPEMLWGRLPDWTQQDTERAKALIEQRNIDEMLDQVMASGAQIPGGSSRTGGAARGGLLDDDEVRRLNRMRGGYGPDWDGDGKPD